MDWKSFHTLFKRITFEPSFSIGLSDGINVPMSHYFYLGGISTFPLFGNIPLSPLHHFDMIGAEAVSAKFSIRYKLSKRHFLNLFVNTGSTADSVKDLLNFGTYPVGVGMKYSFKSILGPIEFSVIYSTFSSSFLYHLNIGFTQ